MEAHSDAAGSRAGIIGGDLPLMQCGFVMVMSHDDRFPANAHNRVIRR